MRGWKWKIDKKDTKQIDLGLDMDTNIFKYEICLNVVMVICIKQHLTNIWSLVHDKVKQHWSWVEKKHC